LSPVYAFFHQVGVQPLRTAPQLQPTDTSTVKPVLPYDEKSSAKEQSRMQATDDADADTTDTTAPDTGSESKVRLQCVLALR
jgi:hypothetical protein